VALPKQLDYSTWDESQLRQKLKELKVDTTGIKKDELVKLMDANYKGN
jgi:hypothetical protein